MEPVLRTALLGSAGCDIASQRLAKTERWFKNFRKRDSSMSMGMIKKDGVIR